MRKILVGITFSILFVLSFFIFSPQARANFTESFSEVVNSLRGVEEEAVKIFMPEPQSLDAITVGNRESEALTAKGVLYEAGISPISYLGNCDDNSIGEENRNHAQNVLNAYADMINGSTDGAFDTNSTIGRMNSDKQQLQNYVNNLALSFTSNCDFYDIRFDQLPELQKSMKFYVNGVDLSPGTFLNSNQLLLKNDKNYSVQLALYDMYGGIYKTQEYFISKENLPTLSLNLVSTGVIPSFSKGGDDNEAESNIVEEVSTRAEFTSSVQISTSGDGTDLVFTVTADSINVKYYKFELNGQIVYSETPSIKIANAGKPNNGFVINLTLLNEYGEEGSTLSHNQGGSQQGCTSNTEWKNINGLEFFYFDNNSYVFPSWNVSPSSVVIENNRIWIAIEKPQNHTGPIFASHSGNVFFETGWIEDTDPQDAERNYNFAIPIPNGVEGVIELFASNGGGLLSNKISINISGIDIKALTTDLNDPNFFPVMGSNSPFGYDMLGATQIEGSFPTLDAVEDLIRVRAFKFYINGKCIGQQRAWNIVDDEFILNTIYPLGYAVLTQLPPLSDLNYEITAIGFNGNESSPISTVIVTYLEPTVELLDIGIIDTNWIVYNEYAYVYYYLSMSRQEYQQYINQQNYIWMTVEMCCNENNRLYYPSIVFKPVPDYASCSDLTIINRSYTNNPAFLGVRTNPNLEVIEFIKNDDDSALSYENSGGELGDIIYAVNGVDVFGEVELANIFNNLSAGERVEIVVSRGGTEQLLEIQLDTYPDRFNIDEINEATGCFDSSGRAVGVFKVKMNEGYSENQYLNWFQFNQQDANAESRWPTPETLWYASYKEFNKNGFIYAGMGPGDDLQSYGAHNVDFSKATFKIASNNQRASNRPSLIQPVEVTSSNNSNLFNPSDSLTSPFPIYYFELEDADYLDEYNLIPQVNMSTLGDCCFREETTNGVRTYGPGTKVVYFLPDVKALKGWNIHSITCSLVVINRQFEDGDPAELLENPYLPEQSTIPFINILEQTVGPNDECLFNYEEFKEFPFFAVGVTACYVNANELYYCIKSAFTALPFNSWG